MLVYRAGACPCQCVHHSIWFDAVSAAHGHGSNSCCHDHCHAASETDGDAINSDMCVRVANSPDLISQEKTRTVHDVVANSIALVGMKSYTVVRATQQRWANISSKEPQFPVSVRAALQVFLL
ncbi:MAG: hypothetical protein KDB27_00140 [Planctomycetales bacterium]|nr:hypothetical protein [Planctomycetales bacterium]